MSTLSSKSQMGAIRPYTSVTEFTEAHRQLTGTFATGRTKSLKWRKWQLKQLWWMLEDNEQVILDALALDLGRHEFESIGADLRGLKADILEHLSHVEEWAADKPIKGSGFIFGTLGKARMRQEPLGVALIIGAWNFPFLLTLQPVIAAISAGCAIMIKPSELAVASQNVMSDLVGRYLDQSAIRLVTGGPQETTKLLELKFNHIFFTGSTKVAKYVAAAAAKHLAPTVLELGGQGPAIVTSTADVDNAAKRIAYAKFANSGQICLSVNHVFADPKVHDKFVERLLHWSKTFAGDRDTSPMCTIINERNFDRLSTMLEDTDGKVHSVWEADPENNRLGSTIVTDVTMQDSVLSEELFGPICPVIKADYHEAVRTTAAGAHPLAIYIFSNDQSEIKHILENTNSGGVTVNDTMMHYGVPGAPFGGVGDSGMGYYHGEFGFLAFSHQRTVFEMPSMLAKLLEFRYPPYDIRNKGKFAVKNKLGFRRGETMEDQRVGGRSISRLIGICILALAVAGPAARSWFNIDARVFKSLLDRVRS